MTTLERTDSATKLADLIEHDAALQDKVRDDPVGTLRALAKPLEEDKWVYRIVVAVLGLTILFVVSGVFVLKVVDNQTGIPDALVAIGSAAVAALAGLLTPFPTRR